MITIEKKKYEKLVTQLIYTRDIRQLVRTYSLDKIFYFSVLKDISNGSGSPNYPILKSIAHSKNLDENFIVEQAKSVLEFYVPFYQTKSPEYYEILNVRNDATEQEIRRSWIELMKSHHPDKVGKEGLDRAKKINEAYQVLKDNRKRDVYDRKHLPYIPVFVSSGRFSESSYYALTLVVVAIIALVYALGSGWVFKSEEAQKKSAGVMEDTVEAQIASRGAAGTTSTESKEEVLMGSTRADSDASKADMMPETEGAEPTKKGAADTQSPEEIAVVSERDRRDEEGAGVTQKGVQVADSQDEKSESVREPNAELHDKKGGSKSGSVDQEVIGQTGSQKSSQAALPDTKTLEKEHEVDEKDGKEALKVAGKEQLSDDLKTEVPSGLPAVGKAAREESTARAEGKVYTVREGDNLWTIARKFDTRSAEIMRLNGLKDNQLKAGQELIIPSGGDDLSAGTAEISAKKEPETPVMKETGVENKPEEVRKVVETNTIYKVRQGDSLWVIARKFDTTTAELVRLNNLADNKVRVGEELIVRGTGLSASPMNGPAVKKAADEKKDSERKESVKESADTNVTEQKTDKIIVTGAKAVTESNRQPQPDRDSLYVFVSEYVSAYKNGDVSKLESLFSPGAVENGVSITKVLRSYSSNFQTMEILTYDIRIKKAKIVNDAGTVAGDFLIMFKDRRTGVTKNARGRIDWLLNWNDGTWKVSELSYKVEKTDSVGR